MTHDRADAEDAEVAEEGWNIDPRKLTPHDWFEIFQTQPPYHGAADLFTYGPDPELDRASAFVVATRGLQEESASSAFFAKTVVVLPPDAPGDAAVVARIARWSERPDAATRAIPDRRASARHQLR